jgi:hypothetical protein
MFRNTFFDGFGAYWKRMLHWQVLGDFCYYESFSQESNPTKRFFTVRHALFGEINCFLKSMAGLQWQ